MTNKPVLKVSQISFGYNRNEKIINNLSLEIYSGERVGIIGPNGTGKTTLFLLISGVKKPSSGEIILYDKKVKVGKFNPNIGMVFQNTDDQLFCPTVWEDVAFGPTNMGLSREEVKKRVNNSLKILGIEKLKDKAPHHLSGGEKRLAAIAGVLAMESKLVIYDEPTSNLDIRYRRKLINFINSSKQDAMLISSHDLEFILEVCNRVILLDEGRIVADGKPKEILGDENLMEAHGLEKPHSLIPHVIDHHEYIKKAE
ncbi:energy-coupling factor ABC transporter ATP-binding protein [Thermohalobacter berrensis]|uniref:Cobalt ABC transporter ATP-binding protein n=1 Tax=Thermohalobacter berrensis TaxID=99594 RepID=A0A419SU66_9FIRM|nr:ABC transporter ATP-binding protein [Thermohalobacter berrensis]RKD28790.1 cobalt ABC transporter ATP-binding protein [Thermohalobacter berrensis]